MNSQNIPALAISVCALVFTVFAFWWMHWRTGRLRVFGPRTYTAAALEDLLIVILPIVFFNDGAAPIIVQNLRLRFTERKDDAPLEFVATKEAPSKNEGREFASQFPVRGREAIRLYCEFQRRPGGIRLDVGSYPLVLEAKLNEKQRWSRLCAFSLHVNRKAAVSVNERLLTHDNAPDTE